MTHRKKGSVFIEDLNEVERMTPSQTQRLALVPQTTLGLVGVW